MNTPKSRRGTLKQRRNEVGRIRQELIKAKKKQLGRRLTNEEMNELLRGGE
jgi:hypothetical protein